MLASPADLDSLTYPVLASPKLDGIRACVVGGKLLSRSLKPIPNASIRQALEWTGFEGLDGELICGNPTDDDVYRRTNSFVMAQNKFGYFTYYVFDKWDEPGGYMDRAFKVLSKKDGFPAHMQWHPNTPIHDREHLDAYEAEQTELGYEGIMLRSYDGAYKFGRSTALEGLLLKVKRFEDSEAELIGIEEEMFNGNEAQTNELGRTKRSTAKAGLVGKGTMGALVMRDIHTGVEFKIGTGFTASQRAAKWPIGSVHVYKHFPVGVKDKPRHPVYKGPRSKIDIGAPA